MSYQSASQEDCYILQYISCITCVILTKREGMAKKNILSLVPLGIIYGGKNLETARSDLKMVLNCKISQFLGLEIRRFKRSGFEGGGGWG